MFYLCFLFFIFHWFWRHILNSFDPLALFFTWFVCRIKVQRWWRAEKFHRNRGCVAKIMTLPIAALFYQGLLTAKSWKESPARKHPQVQPGTAHGFNVSSYETSDLPISSTGKGLHILLLGVAAGVFRVLYFEFLHILVIYLVLGIGADDIFVFKDTFCHIIKARRWGRWLMVFDCSQVWTRDEVVINYSVHDIHADGLLQWFYMMLFDITVTLDSLDTFLYIVQYCEHINQYLLWFTLSALPTVSPLFTAQCIILYIDLVNIATSQDLTSKGSWGREITLFQENLYKLVKCYNITYYNLARIDLHFYMYTHFYIININFIFYECSQHLPERVHERQNFHSLVVADQLKNRIAATCGINTYLSRRHVHI